MNHELINKFIFYLKSQSHPVPPAVIYHTIQDSSFDVHVAGRELYRLGILEFVQGGLRDTYMLNMPTKKLLDSLPFKFKDDPYSFFLEEEKNIKSRQELISKLEYEQLKLEVEKLREDYFSFSKREGKSFRQELVQWIAIFLSAIAILVSLMK